MRKTPYRWLDLQKLCQLLLPRNTIIQIKYFTALVSARPDDPNQTVRQQVYLRALATLPNVSIHYGHFLTHEITMPRVPVPGRRQEYVRVIKTEEKGSDVNLATHLLHDAHMGRFEVAVVVSNDSRPAGADQNRARSASQKGRHPEPAQAAKPRPAAAYRLHQAIRAGALQAAQFPATMSDQHGTFTKPAAW